ncbi:MAG: phospholipase D-like domain-containing protein [Bdellovibrionia bacterium]
MARAYLLVAAVAVSACSQKESTRNLAQSAEQVTLEKYYAARVENDFAKFKAAKLQEKIDMHSSPRGESVERTPLPLLEKELQDLKYEAQRSQAVVTESFKRSQSIRNVDQPLGVEVRYEDPWRQHHDEIIVHNLNEFPLHNGKPVRQVSISNSTAKNVLLQLTNYTASWDTSTLSFRPKPKGNPVIIDTLIGKLNCNTDSIIYTRPQNIKARANTETEFTWYDSEFTATRPVIHFGSPNAECVLTFARAKDRKFNYGIRITPEDKELLALMSPEKKGEVCLLPQATNQPKAVGFFLSPQLTQTTCPVKIESYKTLERSLDGINYKIKMLTGSELTPGYLKKGDPFAPLDFSKAPQLDAILISYLVFRADFGGHVIMQALKHHAEKGTLIRIAVSDVISLGKDRQMLFDFQAKYPNVKLLFYKYRSEGKGIKDWINSFHRTNHIKFFLTYSQRDDNGNAVILGGRNIHDGFIFNAPISNYINPTVINYAEKNGDESWARWEDFETYFQSRTIVNKLMSQFFSVFHADYREFYIRQFSVPVPLQSEVNPAFFDLADNEIYMRSMVSIPFKDDMLLERTFIQLLDSAEKRVLLSTPYFNITDKMLAAFERAADRGVKVELITRLDLDGDTADLVLSDVNKKSINKIYQKIKVYEYTTKGKILHSKLIIVDDSVVMMGSVNLNLRSFYHDIENVAFIYGKGFNKQISDLYEVYKKESKLLNEKQSTTWWKSIIIKIIGTAL